MFKLPPNPETTFLITKEAAALLRLSPYTLETWRRDGLGPNYHKFGRNVRYSLADLRAWGQSKNLEPTEAWVRSDGNDLVRVTL